MPNEPQFDIAFSFAGPDRPYVELLVAALKSRQVTVFYDFDYQATLWGADLIESLERVYRLDARHVIIVISKFYTTRSWPRHERRAAQARAFDKGDDYILPLRLDDTEVPGVLSTTGFIDGRQTTISKIVNNVLVKLGRSNLITEVDELLPRLPEENEYHHITRIFSEIGATVHVKQMPLGEALALLVEGLSRYTDDRKARLLELCHLWNSQFHGMSQGHRSTVGPVRDYENWLADTSYDKVPRGGS